MTPRLMYVTDPSTCRLDVVDVALAAVEGGADAVQVRGARSDREAHGIASSLVARLAGAALVLVNERLDIALAAGASGVHLKDGSLDPGEVRETARRLGHAAIVVSVACHDAAGLARAGMSGADMATLGPLHEAHGAQGRGAQALRGMLEAATERVPRAILLQGGVTAADAAVAPSLGGRATVGLAAVRWFQDAPSLGEVTLRARALRDGLRSSRSLA